MKTFNVVLQFPLDTNFCCILHSCFDFHIKVPSLLCRDLPHRVQGETLSSAILYTCWTLCAASMCPKLILNISKGKTKVTAVAHITSNQQSTHYSYRRSSQKEANTVLYSAFFQETSASAIFLKWKLYVRSFHLWDDDKYVLIVR